MAEYRQIHTRIWKDSWFIDLGSAEKLLFIYLFSNERACLAGIYDLSPKVIAFETDLPFAAVEVMLNQFEADGKIRREGNLLWMPNLIKYNAANLHSPKIQTHLRTTLAGLPDCQLKADWIAHYNSLVSEEYRIDTLSIPMPESSSEQEQEQEHEQEQEQEQEQEHDSSCADAQTKPLTGKNLVKAELQTHFCERAKMRAPPTKTKPQRTAAGRRWWTPLLRIGKITDWDIPAGRALIDAAIAQMDKDGLTISAPQSIVSVAESINGKQKRGAPLDGATPQPAPAPSDADMPGYDPDNAAWY